MLSDKAKRALRVAIANKDEATEVIAELQKIAAAAAVAPMGTTVDLVGVDGSGSNAAPLVETEARLDAIEAKIDEIIAALS